jgi:large subunit ribosomal protein L22
MESRAVLKFLRMAPRKVRVVADAIRGKRVSEAMEILRFVDRRSAPHVLKVLNSAVHNALQKGGVDADSLYVKTIMVDGGPSLKRFLPRAMGRATQVLKYTSHVTVVVDVK